MASTATHTGYVSTPRSTPWGTAGLGRTGRDSNIDTVEVGAVFINTVQVAAGGQLVVAVLCTGSFSGHLAHPARRTRRMYVVRGDTVGLEVVPAHIWKP